MSKSRIIENTKSLQAELYSLVELDKTLRDFKLPGDPYKMREALAYLKTLGVVFYRDDRHSRGVLLEPGDGDVPLSERSGFVAYKSIVEMHPITFTVKSWTTPAPAIVEKNGDSFVWILFNSPRTIVSMSPESVTVL